MADFSVAEVGAVQPQAQPAQPKVYEIINFVSAIDESGKEVKVRGQKMRVTVAQLEQQIARVDAESARLKAILAEIQK